MPPAKPVEEEKYRDIKNMTFEQALGELEAIVRRLESGQGALEESIDDYARGTALKEHCAGKLADARLKVEKIVKQSGGGLAAEPFDAEA